MFPETLVTLISTFEKSWFCALPPPATNSPTPKTPIMRKNAVSAVRFVISVLPTILNSISRAQSSFDVPAPLWFHGTFGPIRPASISRIRYLELQNSNEQTIVPLRRKTLLSETATTPSAPPSSKRFAFLVASGIFLSRVAGLVRDRVFAHYFGNSAAADVFKAALRIPNFLQNLFGEGVLSASFIPVYASLLARDDKQEARRTAGAVAALLALTTSIFVLLGVLTAPWLIEAIAPGFHGEKRDLTVRLVRILFPGAGLLVASAWCLGVLNSHRKFFISYSAPVLWNIAMIAGMIAFGKGRHQNSLVVITAWASVAGSALQVGVQLPTVLKLLGGLQLA